MSTGHQGPPTELLQIEEQQGNCKKENTQPTPMLSAILGLLSHFYAPLYACNNLKLVYLCTLEALEIKNSLIVKKNTEKINHFKVVCYWGFRDPPTHPLVCY